MRSKFGALRRFQSDQSGAIALLFGLGMVMLFLFVGVAVDGGRAYNASAMVGSALDAAGLTGAKALNETTETDAQVTTATLNALAAQMASLHDRGVTLTGQSVSIDRANSAVTVSTTVHVRTMLASVAGFATIDFPKTSTTSYDMAQIELVLALDITGSMNQIPSGDTQPKITTLISAASNLVNSLYDMASTDTNIKVGLVPWSSSVNAGPYAALVTGSASTSGWSRPWWYNPPASTDCVTERTGTGATSDEAPSPSNYAGTFTATSAHVCPTQAVAPLIGRTQRATMLATVAGMTAAGGTAGHLGMAWGWYMISPNWAPYFPTDSQPAAYGTRVIKSVVLMTDGIYNTDYVGGTLNGAYDDTSYTLFQQICSGMRAEGINIYTIGFDLSDARAVSELQTCAGTGNFYAAANSSQLRSVFADIVKRLNVVRIKS